MSSGDRILTIPFGGDTYRVLCYVPTGLSPGTRAPIVITLHGSGSTGGDQLTYSGMRGAADAAGFIVVAPSGARPDQSGYAWNVPGTAADGRDDIAFLDQVRATALTMLPGDDTRVFLAGYSGGGRMASAYACARPGNLRAFAAVAGLRAGRPLPGDPARIDTGSFQPVAPVPVIAFHGQADDTNPYDGGGSEYWGYSVPVALGRWALVNGGTPAPQTTSVSPHVIRTSYSGSTGADVVLYTVTDGGHTWPGSDQDNGNGTVTQEIDANELIWQFFAARC